MGGFLNRVLEGPDYTERSLYLITIVVRKEENNQSTECLSCARHFLVCYLKLSISLNLEKYYYPHFANVEIEYLKFK